MKKCPYSQPYDLVQSSALLTTGDLSIAFSAEKSFPDTKLVEKTVFDPSLIWEKCQPEMRS
jgi:hypothetical protein